MKITAFTVIICLFAILSLVRLLRRTARDGMALRSAIVWLITWLSLAVFSIFPDLLNRIVAAAGMENRLFFLLTLAVLVLTALLFNLTSRVDRMHRDLGLAIREIALANYRIDAVKRVEEDNRSTYANSPEPASGPRNPPQESIGDNVIAIRQNSLDHTR
jgi:hypothetical protein